MTGRRRRLTAIAMIATAAATAAALVAGGALAQPIGDQPAQPRGAAPASAETTLVEAASVHAVKRKKKKAKKHTAAAKRILAPQPIAAPRQETVKAPTTSEVAPKAAPRRVVKQRAIRRTPARVTPVAPQAAPAAPAAAPAAQSQPAPPPYYGPTNFVAATSGTIRYAVNLNRSEVASVHLNNPVGVVGRWATCPDGAIYGEQAIIRDGATTTVLPMMFGDVDAVPTADHDRQIGVRVTCITSEAGSVSADNILLTIPAKSAARQPRVIAADLRMVDPNGRGAVPFAEYGAGGGDYSFTATCPAGAQRNWSPWFIGRDGWFSALPASNAEQGWGGLYPHAGTWDPATTIFYNAVSCAYPAQSGRLQETYEGMARTDGFSY